MKQYTAVVEGRCRPAPSKDGTKTHNIHTSTHTRTTWWDKPPRPNTQQQYQRISTESSPCCTPHSCSSSTSGTRYHVLLQFQVLLRYSSIHPHDANYVNNSKNEPTSVCQQRPQKKKTECWHAAFQQIYIFAEEVNITVLNTINLS